MGLFFYPRGGSAQVARYLSRALARDGRHVTLCSGSLGPSGAPGDAATIFRGIDVVPAAYDDAVARWQRGEDPMDAPFPMHPSYEARSGVPDRAFPWVSPAQGERMTEAWARLIAGSDAMSRARLLHLHHLTPIHDAVVAAVPDVPVLTHLHGTELRMLDAISRGDADLVDGPHADWWEAPHARGRATGGRDHRDLALRARARRAPARARSRHRPLSAERRRYRPLHAVPPERRGAEGALAALARTGRAGMGRDDREPGQRAVRRARGARRVLRPGERRSAARADVRRSLPRLQARPAPDPRLRPSAGPHGGSCPARHLGRHAGGVGGRASAHRRHTRGRRRGLLHRLARPRRPAARPQLRGLPSSRRRPTSRSGSCTSRRWPASSR